MHANRTSSSQTPHAVHGSAAASTPYVATNSLARRERDFGIGYGNSSGYGRSRRYSHESFEPRFRII